MVDRTGQNAIQALAIAGTRQTSQPAAASNPVSAPILSSLSTTGVTDPNTILRVIHTSVANTDHYAIQSRWTGVVAWSRETAFNHTGTTVDLTGRNPSQSYDVQVGACNVDETVINWSATATASTLPGPSGAIKSNYGHYAQSASFDNQSAKNAEIALVRACPAQILGLMLFYFWKQFEDATQGSYNFNILDGDYNALTGWDGTTHVAPKRLAMYIGTEFRAGTAAQIIPSYILNNPGTYGNSPTGGQGGWWTNPNGGVSIAHWRTSVGNRLQALYPALAAHVLPDGFTVNTSPYIEWIAPYGETAELAPTDPTFSNAAWVTEIKAIATACHAPFSRTEIAMMNNYAGSTADANSIQQFFLTTLSAGSGPDIFGGSTANLTWGQTSHIGGYGGTDMRGKVSYIASVQSTEQGDVSYFTNADIFNQANNVLKANRIAWTIISWTPGGRTASNFLGTATSITQWKTNPAGFGGVLYFITQNPITNITYPSLLP